MKEKGTVGLSIGIYNKGKTFFYNFGSTEKDKKTIPTENTGYQIGSVTKTFISFLLAKAVDEKKVNIDDDIRKYLDGEYPNLEYAGNPIRLINLANISSGLPDLLPPVPDYILKAPPDSSFFLTDKFYRNVTKRDFFTALHNVKLDTVPGTYSKHSNTAAILLGYILESVYRNTIEELFEKYIVKPYSLNCSLFLSSKTDRTNIAKGYSDKGELILYEPAFMNSSSGIISTSSDLLKYASVLLANKNNVTQLVTNRNIEVDVQTNRTKQIGSKSPFNPSAYSVSLNWLSYKFDNGTIQYWTDGTTRCFTSYIVFFPQLNSAIVLLANMCNEKVYGALPNMSNAILNLLGGK